MSESDPDNPANKRLLIATKPFAEEIPLKSWWHVVLTFGILASILVGAGMLPWWPVRTILSIVGGLVTVRAFILFHDFMHSALLYQSRLGKAIFYVFGLLALAPPRYWRFSHNFHHANVGRPIDGQAASVPLVTSDVGSFPLMSTEQWREASTWQRIKYRVTRHPLTILMAYLTVFAIGFCIVPLLRDPRKYWDGAVALLAHGGLIAVIWTFGGPATAFFSIMLPFALAAALGAYLFYAQHNFEGMRVMPREGWTFYHGAMESSGYMELGPIMRWFTGNIGYHHIHHLNSRIPFYRLPEVLEAVPELKSSSNTTLHPGEILKCFRLNLWDVEHQRLVAYDEAFKPSAGQGQPSDGPR